MNLPPLTKRAVDEVLPAVARRKSGSVYKALVNKLAQAVSLWEIRFNGGNPLTGEALAYSDRCLAGAVRQGVKRARDGEPAIRAVLSQIEYVTDHDTTAARFKEYIKTPIPPDVLKQIVSIEADYEAARARRFTEYRRLNPVIPPDHGEAVTEADFAKAEADLEAVIDSQKDHLFDKSRTEQISERRLYIERRWNVTEDQALELALRWWKRRNP